MTRSSAQPSAPPAPSETPEGIVLLPSAGYRGPTREELTVLKQIGKHWEEALGGRRLPVSALPVDPDLAKRSGRLSRTSRFERIVQAETMGFQPAQRGTLVATEQAITPPIPIGGAFVRLRHLLLGPPLATTAIVQERLSKFLALAILSSDALSSVAYGTEAMLSVLVLAGPGALGASLPIGAAIVVLMIVVGASYRQTIRAYPRGGGSYIVASDNLGRVPGLTAAAGLMVDYVLTVAVSVSAGIAAVTSALPAANRYTVGLDVAVIAIILGANLRGIRQSGVLFAVPTYAFVAGMAVLIIVGMVQAAAHGWAVVAPPPTPAVESLGFFLVLRAFASGCSAMTGIEAIADGVPVFKPPEWRNARTTLTYMISLLAVMFAGITVLAHLDGAVPGSETVLSQIAAHTFGRGVLYAYIQMSTALILVLAANTAFSDFPRLLFFLARDRFAPRPFLRMGDRLVYSNGIVVLAVLATVLVVAFGGSTDRLIALYAVGVFLAFTLSQIGMTLHWWRGHRAGWRHGLALNALGAFLSSAVVVIVAIAKFTEGAWVVAVVVPVMVMLFLRIRRHYDCIERETNPRASAYDHGRVSLLARHTQRGTAPPSERAETPDQIRHLAIVPVAWLDLATLRAVAYAVSLDQPVLALHVAADEEDARRIRALWQAWGNHVPLEVIMSPYRAVVVPMANYIAALQRANPELTVTVVLPELVVHRRWQAILHNQVGLRLRALLRARPGVVITSVPYHLRC